MKKKTLQFAIGLLIISNGAFAQWSTSTNGDAYRFGNVGIGTGATAPLTQLHINSDNYGSILLGEGGPGGVVITKELDNRLAFWNNGIYGQNQIQRFTILQNGNIGIGPIIPLAQLHINNGNYGAILLGDGGPGGVGITKELDNRLAFWNNGTYGQSQSERLTILQNGNVGIGTSMPLAQLHINNNNNYGSILLGDGGPGGVAITKELDNRIAIWNNGIYGQSQAERFTILQNGNVGIGTSNPGSFKLAVEGKIVAREIQVTLANPFPDYVFGSSYKLRSLYTLENYINQNKHLPGIPSAVEVEKKGGVELGEMNRKLLEKIEELTLYIIEINKKVEKLEKENEALKEKKQ